MIKLIQVTKEYSRPEPALKDISFHLERGQFCFLTGHSGSGKSTALRLAHMVERPSVGEVRVSGFSSARTPRRDVWKLRRRVGFVFQDFRLLFHKKVFENVAIVLRVIGISRKEIRRRVFNALRIVNLHHKMWEYPSQLSYGEQQRLAIARAVVNNPKILLADEPTGNLDPEFAFEIITLFKEINKQGATVIICTHDRDLIRHFGEKILFLYKGKLIRKEAF